LQVLLLLIAILLTFLVGVIILVERRQSAPIDAAKGAGNQPMRI
jgi:preprotein translocase subunit SecG